MSNQYGHTTSHSPVHSHSPTKAELAEEKADKAEKDKADKAEAKAEKEAEAAKPKLGAFDADRFTEELRAVVNDKGMTPNNPTLRSVFAELAGALDRSRSPKPPEVKPAAEKPEKPAADKA
jgi:hypothetical protein